MTTKIEKAYIKSSIPSKKVSDKILDIIEQFDEGGSGSGSVTSVNGEVGDVVLDKADVGLSNVNNTSDANKPVSTAQQTALDLKLNASEKGAINGVATLDGGGKIPLSQLPNSVMELQGAWNASTNSPALADGSGNPGSLYKVTTAGSQDLGSGLIEFSVNDLIVYGADGVWFKSDSTDAVVSVNGLSGVVVLDKSDLGLGNVDNTSDLNKPVSTAQAAADSAVQSFAIQRSNHTGTQLSSTISDFSAAVKTVAVSDSILDGVTDVATSQNAVFDALALKANLSNPTFSGNVLAGDFSSTDSNFNTISFKENLAEKSSTGVLNGLVLSIGSPNTTFSVSAGSANFATNSGSTSLKKVTIAAQNNIPVTNLLTNPVTYIGMDSSGAIVQQVTKFTSIQRRTIAIIGTVAHTNLTNVTAIAQAQNVVLSPASQLQDLEEGIGPFNINGNIYSANGANLNINKSSGSIFKIGCNWANSQLNPNIISLSGSTPVTFQYRFQNGVSGSDTTAIIPNQYDLGGTSTIVPNNRFTVQRIYSFVSGVTRIQPGQALYVSLADAIAAIQTESFVTDTTIADNGVLRGFLCIKGDTTSLTDATRVKFLEAPKFGGTAGVGGLSTTTLQGAYNNSNTPEIVTNSTLGSLTIQRGSASDTDYIFEGKNGAATTTFSVTGAGVITGSNLSGTNTGNQTASTVPSTPSGNLSATDVQSALNELQSDIDAISVSPTTKFIKTVILGDWAGPSAGNYTLTVPFSSHGITNPVATCYELNGSSFDSILVPTNLDASNNLIFTVTQTPDSRFVGKIVIV